MNEQALRNLLERIGSKEAPKGYGQIYGGARGVGPVDKIDVSKMTLGEVIKLQQKMKANKSKSTACGRYQFILKTLNATIKQMALTVTQVWDDQLQDRMAVHLMKQRGLDNYLLGKITPEKFCNNLAQEWASLPVVTRIKGQTRIVSPGETYYAGDKLNKAHHKPEDILALVKALKSA